MRSSIEQAAFCYLKAIHKQKQKGRQINYHNLILQPYLRSNENFKLKEQQELFAMRSQMNNLKANFCSRQQIENCDKCEKKMNNEHLFECTWKTNNLNNITYEQLLNGTILEQKQGIKFVLECEENY